MALPAINYGLLRSNLKKTTTTKKQRQKQRLVEDYEGKGGDLVALLQQLLAVALN